MPRYDYKQCSKCGNVPLQSPRVVPMSARNNQRCWKCGEKLDKEMSAPALHGFDSNGSSGHR